ncbi:MAG: ribosome biogenesis GTPase YlqF [Burkholderiaceae bacterium]|jgi:ribosome biogenesis GTPase A|nr:Ribosome biogenesis GTPase A [Betaproteobacteria bacterium MOLA814]
MAIQWFPGHMHLTRQAIGERIKNIDVVIEMLDARLPGSSANPMLAELIGDKPGLKILSKQDLADPVQTEAWLAHYNALPGMSALGLDTSTVSPSKALIAACKLLAPKRGGMVKPMRVLICGIPNVGKSTLINTLKGKRAAKTGDEAGVTKLEQRIALANDFYVFDTPGVLWPRIIVEQSGFNLSVSGAIGVNAFDEDVVALELLHYMIAHYPKALSERYKIEDVASHTDETMLEAVARYRGAVQSGGRLNTNKAAHIVIHDFRSGAFGRITIETPAQFAEWLVKGQMADAERTLRKAAIEKVVKSSYKAKAKRK